MNMRRVFIIVMTAVYVCTLESAQLIRAGERKEAKQCEEAIIAEEQRSLLTAPKNILQLSDQECIRSFRQIVDTVPKVTEDQIYDYLQEMGDLVTTLKTPYKKTVGESVRSTFCTPVSSLYQDEDGLLVSPRRNIKQFWHTPESLRVLHPSLIVHGGIQYSFKESVQLRSPLSLQYAAASICNMALVEPENFIVRPRNGALNRHAIMIPRENGDLVELNAVGVSAVRVLKGNAKEFHALLVSRSRQCLVLVVDQTLRFMSTQNWNVEHELFITNKNLMIRHILQYLRDSTVILDGYFYDEESGKIRQMKRPTHGWGRFDKLGMLVLSRGRLATVDLIGNVKIWNMRTEECVGSFVTKQHCAHTYRAVNDMLELSDGNLATAGSDGSIKIWRETRNPYRDIFSMIRAREKKARAKNMRSIFGCGSAQQD